jgi:tripartite-type tricarboxylate transporter receptor subunit TctC
MTDSSLSILRRRLVAGGAAAGTLALAPRMARAQASDTLPGTLRFLVGSAGAGPDILARLVADRLRAARGWNVVVENRLGAGGRIAIDATKDAPPDGLTMMVLSIELLTLYPLVFSKLNYDSFKDFVPVSGISSSPYALAVNAKSEHRTLAELVAWLKANPKASAFGTPGLGTPQQFLGTMIGRDAGMEFRHVPYKGGAPALQDLMGGQIPCIITAFATAAGQARAGAIRILAHSGQSRLKSAPDIPTFSEAGFKSLVAEGDFIISAQSRAPADITRRVSEAVVADIRSDSFRAAVEKLGQEPLPAPPAEVTERMRRNHALWAAVVKATNFKAMED